LRAKRPLVERQAEMIQRRKISVEKLLERSDTKMKAIRLREAAEKDAVEELKEIQTLVEKAERKEIRCPYCHIEVTTVNTRTGEVKRCQQCKKRSRILKKYGLTLWDFSRALAEQQERCAICGGEFGKGGAAPAVDHCHDNGHFRGVLCRGCNTGLGCFLDDAGRLENAIKYLNFNIVARKWCVACDEGAVVEIQ